MSEEIWKRVDQVAAKLTELGQQLGPDVWELTLAAMRVQALNGLLWAALGATMMYAAYRMGLRIGPAIDAVCKMPAHADDGAAVGRVILLIFTTAGAAVIGFAVFAVNISAWTFMGLYDPRLLLAKKVLGL